MIAMLSMALPGWAKYATAAALCAAIWGHGYIRGAGRVEQRLEAQHATEMAALLGRVQAAAKIADRVVYQYIDRYHVVRERGATITREVTKYVTAKSDAGCPIPVGFVRLHDAAAGNHELLPATAIGADDPATGVTLSGVAVTVGENYTACNGLREQLIALQDWAKQTESGP